jgi:type II secretory pathway pseudopilin PulG
MSAAFRPSLSCHFYGARPRRGQAGAVLLEVVLALVLFVGAAAVLTSGLSSSLDALERLRFNTHAADLAVSVLSELQLGIKTLAAGGPQPFEAPLEGWTWEAVATPVQSDFDEDKRFTKIEVIIRHSESALVHRLSQVLPVGGGTRDGQSESAGAGLF